jgi:hypothetical protein
MTATTPPPSHNHLALVALVLGVLRDPVLLVVFTASVVYLVVQGVALVLAVTGVGVAA